MQPTLGVGSLLALLQPDSLIQPAGLGVGSPKYPSTPPTSPDVCHVTDEGIKISSQPHPIPSHPLV